MRRKCVVREAKKRTFIAIRTAHSNPFRLLFPILRDFVLQSLCLERSPSLKQGWVAAPKKVIAMCIVNSKNATQPSFRSSRCGCSSIHNEKEITLSYVIRERGFPQCEILFSNSDNIGSTFLSLAVRLEDSSLSWLAPHRWNIIITDSDFSVWCLPTWWIKHAIVRRMGIRH